MNSWNSKTSNAYRIFLNLSVKLNLKGKDKYAFLSNLYFLNIYYTMEDKKKISCKNNKFKISALTWNEEFELPNGSYSVSDFQDYL